MKTKKVRITKAKETEKSNVMVQLRGVMSSQLYEWQDIRKDTFNRVRDVIHRIDKGIGLNETPDKLKEKEYLSDYEDSKLLDKFSELKAKKKLNKIEIEYVKKLLDMAYDCKTKEKEYKKIISSTTDNELVWTEFLQYVKGIGPLSTAMLLYYFNYCEKARYVSSLWQFSGLSVKDGHAPKITKGEKLTYNPKLRVFMWRISDCFVKQRTPFYRDIYDKEKDRQKTLVENKAANAPKSLLHADLRARRKMMKMFLSHYYSKCKRLTKQEEAKPYQFDKLGHTHFIDVDDLIKEFKKIKATKDIKKLKN
jgi:hypothetical protein